MFISQSEILVPPDRMAAIEAAFANRAGMVDHHDGFLGLELLRDARKQGRYLLITRWRSRDCFRAYMKSGDHRRAHARVHEGLEAVDTRGGALQQFESVLQVGAPARVGNQS